LDEIKLTEDEIQKLLDLSDKLSSKTVTLTRCLILGLLSYFADGIQYRELKTALKMSDGKPEVQVDQRAIDVYALTEKGRAELTKIIKWMKTIEKIANQGDEKKCQISTK
jgi:hypothetical protein